jgi:hypothetical protein
MGACKALATLTLCCCACGHPDDHHGGPSTGQRVEILWEVPAKWSLAKVVRYDRASGAHNVTYDSGFEHAAELLPNKWKLMPPGYDGSSNDAEAEAAEAAGAGDGGDGPVSGLAGQPPPPPETESGRVMGHALVGESVRVFWPIYATWQKGVVRQCDVHHGALGKCTVDRVEGALGGTSATYNFSDPALRWRGEFVPDPVRWTLPRQAAFHDAPNFMEVDVDLALVARVRRWYERHVLPHMRDDRGDSWNTSASLAEEEEEGEEEGEEREVAAAADNAGGGGSGVGGAGASRREYRWNRQFAGGKFGSDIKWISPADLPTHERMSAFYHQSGVGRHLEPYLDLTPNNTARRLRVYIPSFVVRSRVRQSYHHHDWLPAGGANGLTLMVPLYDMANATEGCNLLYKDAALKEHVYKYTLGKGAVFGGGTWHASQPCRPRSQFERERPWAFLCFNFGTDKAEYWPTLHENIACSGKLIVRPDGEVAPEASCNSYNDALKQGEQALRDEAQKEILEALTEHAVGKLEVDQLQESLKRIGVPLPAALSLKSEIASFLNGNVKVLLEELAARQREEAAAAKAAAAEEAAAVEGEREDEKRTEAREEL